jgi:hypothetical protein
MIDGNYSKKTIKMKITIIYLLAFILLTATGCTTSQPSESVNEPLNKARQASADGGGVRQEEFAADSFEPQKDAPDAVVKDLYRQHDANKSPFFQTKSRSLVDKYFTKKLADLIWKDANDSKGEVGALGADPLYDAQDTDIKKFNVGAPKIENDRATVNVIFENYGKKTTIIYSLVRQNADWKIADIKYPGGYSLVGLFEENTTGNSTSQTPSTMGEFDGTYQVGETSCVVQPIKMAYELRWKKGAGAMIFFADGENRFVSEEKAAGKDAFVFDDESLTTGKFIRADGKELPVRKIK